MTDRNAAKWLTPAIWALLVLIAAVNGVPALAAAVIVLPPVAATLAYTAGWSGAAAVCLTAGICCAVVMPGQSLWVLLPWCVLNGVIACVPFQKKMTRPVLWSSLCLAAWGGALAMLNGLYGGQLVNGLAQSACDWVNANPERDSILLTAYSNGLSRLEDSEARTLVMRYTGLMDTEMRQQLLFSLRVSIESALPSWICEGMVYHTAITALLCTALPDWRRRKNGEHGILPAMERWYIPRGLGLAIAALCAGWLIAYMSDGGVEMYFGLLCASVFRVAYVIQGICLLQWMEKKVGIRSAMRNVWAIVLSVLAPIVPLIMGLLDQRRDSRNLRPKKEAESL